eukprot:scaffold76416_cov50-Attheya_sp.AAC.3
MGKESGIDNGPPHGHNAQCRHEGVALEAYGRQTVHRPQYGRSPERPVEARGSQNRMGHTHGKRGCQRQQHNEFGISQRQVPRCNGQVGLVDLVNVDVRNLVESRDVEIHEQRGQHGKGNRCEGGSRKELLHGRSGECV